MNKSSLAQRHENVTALPSAAEQAWKRDPAWAAKALQGLRDLETDICDLEHMAYLAGDVIADMLDYENGELVGTGAMKLRQYLISESHSEQVIFAVYHAHSLARALREKFLAAVESDAA